MFKFVKLHTFYNIYTLVANIYLYLCVFNYLMEVYNLLLVQNLRHVCKCSKCMDLPKLTIIVNLHSLFIVKISVYFIYYAEIVCVSIAY